LFENRIHLKFDKIRYLCSHINTEGECLKKTREHNTSWLLESDSYTENKKHSSGFRVFISEDKKDDDDVHLLHVDEKNNYNLEICGEYLRLRKDDLKNLWVKSWSKELEFIFKTLNKKEVSKLSKSFSDFEIYKNVKGEEHIGRYSFEEKALEHKGWYAFVFSYGFDDFFRNKEFEKQMGKRHIYNLSIHHDDGFKLVIFVKNFNTRTFLNVVKTYNSLYLELVKLNKKISVVRDNYFKTKPWKKIK